MHFAVLSHGLPQPSTNGGPMTCWAVMRHLLDAGHAVTVVSLRYENDRFASPGRDRLVREQGAELVVVPVPDAAEAPAGTLAGFFGTARLVPRLREVLEEIRADAAFVYHWDTLAATHGLRVTPRLGAVGDPWHLPGLVRWRMERPRFTRGYLLRSISVLRGIRPATRAMVELLNDCEASASFQAATAEWLRRRGARGCEYLRSPLVDPFPDGSPEHRPANEKPTILLGPSRLEATSTLAGLDLFAREILPRLESELGPNGFVTHVVGEGDPPPALAALLPRPSVVVRGRVEPADEEFRSSDLQLVPTPFVHGVRLRIISAFSFGLCVVAHASETANLPELEDGTNALIGRDGAELARAVVRAARDPEFRARIGAEGRKTYERYFRADVAAAAIARRLEALAEARNALPARG